MFIDQIISNAETLFIKYGSTVALHYVRMQMNTMDAGVGMGVLNACVEHYSEML